MAQANQFLKIYDVPGNDKSFVLGESFKKTHLSEIELLGWNWGVADPAVPTGAPHVKENDAKAKGKAASDHQGQGGPRPSQMTFTKTLDRSTTRLLGAMNNGTRFPRAVLAMEDAYEESPFPFNLKIEFKEIYVVGFSLQANAEGSGVSFSESWIMTYRSIEFKYKWKRDNEGVIIASFTMPPDSDQGPSQKATPTVADKAAAADEQFDAMAKKRGLVKPADMEEFFNAWAKKKGLIK